jgi:hypothetical protein
VDVGEVMRAAGIYTVDNSACFQIVIADSIEQAMELGHTMQGSTVPEEFWPVVPKSGETYEQACDALRTWTKIPGKACEIQRVWVRDRVKLPVVLHKHDHDYGGR